METISNNQSVLRFITAGSVDDGKSTLIGRLLYDSQALLSDQISQLSNNRYKHSTEGMIDFSQLTDGLAAEQEQGITIDVAYRYFATTQRKFIIADTPGHEQYTRNMVTGASTADAAIVLIDVTQLDFSKDKPTLLPQTKRHSALLKLLGCSHIIVAVNKLDLFDYDEVKFLQVKQIYEQLAQILHLSSMHYVPISALNGDNIVYKSSHTPWYQGEPLLSILEKLPNNLQKTSLSQQDAHFPVQKILRQDGHLADDFRAYQGRLEQGSLKEGQQIIVQPAGVFTTIKEIFTPQGRVKKAFAGGNISITLLDDIDISRGDTFLDIDNRTSTTKIISASLCWFDDKPLNIARKYLLKQTTTTVPVKIKNIDFLWDVETLSHTKNTELLKMNDIGRVNISLQKAITATSYQNNHKTGAFILIDDITNHTVAAGMILDTDDLSDWSI